MLLQKHTIQKTVELQQAEVPLSQRSACIVAFLSLACLVKAILSNNWTDHIYNRICIMYLAVPLARADRMQTGTQSIIYMDDKILVLCISLGTYGHTHIVYLLESFLIF